MDAEREHLNLTIWHPIFQSLVLRILNGREFGSAFVAGAPVLSHDGHQHRVWVGNSASLS
jgi:hypothetical protein